MQQTRQQRTKVTTVSPKVLVLRTLDRSMIHIHPAAVELEDFHEQWCDALAVAGVTVDDAPDEAYFDHVTGLDCFTYYR